MFPAQIEHYVRPQTVEEALAAMAGFEEGDAIFLAGGQSVMQAMKSRMLRPQAVIDLQDLAELRGVRRAGDGAVTIGALTRYVEIAGDASLDGAFAALRDAAAHVGDRQVRNRGTLGGSVCWNYVASCMPAVVLGLGGRMHLRSADGATRGVAADDFFRGPLETARKEREILTAVEFDAPAERTGSAYRKWGQVTDALPVVGVCARVTVDGKGQCTAARLALSGLADGAVRAPAGETALAGSAGDDAAIAAALEAVAAAADTHSDMSASADYRRQLIHTIGRAVLVNAFERARA